MYVDRYNSILLADDFVQTMIEMGGTLFGQQFGHWITFLKDGANNLRDSAVGEGIACQVEEVAQHHSLTRCER